MTGSQSQKGAITAPERHYLPNCKHASLLTKTSWDSGRSTSAWEGAPDVHPENQAAGMGKVINRSNHARQTPGHLSFSELGRAQNAGPTESAPGGVPECLNLSGLDLGGACSPGPALDSSRQSNLEPKPKPWEVANLGWLRHCKHTPVLFVCSVPPSPQQDWTSEPKKSVHHRPLVSGWKLDTEETSKQKKLKQREPPWKWRRQ